MGNMIQELLGGVVEERKISIPCFAASNSSTSSQSQSAASSPSSSTDAQQQQQQQQQQNLRCPRCDSSNTKFCYYNNYNLTQPRHFCKTCRRYWTKGGALRNVPIGGGCRKTKAAAPSIVAGNGKTGGSSRTKPMTSLDVMGLVGLGGGGGGGAPELLPPSPILWATMPHSSHLLALSRASQMQQNPNPNPNPSPTHNHSSAPTLINSIGIKDEGLVLGGAQVMAEATCGLNAHSLSLDHLGQLPVGSCSSSLWTNENQFHYHQQLPQQQNQLLSEMPTSSGIQELYQRLSRSSSSTSNNYCNSDHLQAIANNVTSCSSSAAAAATTTMATTTTASIMEPIPLAGGDFGYWNPAMSWSDLSSTTNGAFP